MYLKNYAFHCEYGVELRPKIVPLQKIPALATLVGLHVWWPCFFALSQKNSGITVDTITQLQNGVNHHSKKESTV